ncbi:MAG: hypothetical protein AAF242_12085 [Bacteroidota bacterium]
MKMKLLILTFSILAYFSCNDTDDISTPEPTNPEVTDLRSEYTVRTLTESFDGSGDATIDTAGFIYVADFGDQINNANGIQVTRVDPSDGSLSIFATGLRGPSGNAFDSQGNLFQANIAGNSLSKITPDGTVSTFLGTGFRSPVGVVLDENDNIYVCNCGGNSISKITPEGEAEVFVASSLLNCPNGITIDDAGNLYPVNFNNGRVFKVTPAGEITEFATLPSGSLAHIEYFEGYFYVVGRQANQVFRLDQDGKIDLIAGSGRSGNADGDGDAAEFYIPNGIALSNDGNQIYVVSRLLGTGSPLNPVIVKVIERK